MPLAILQNEWIIIGLVVAAVIIFKFIGPKRFVRWLFNRPEKAVVVTQSESSTTSPDA